MENNIGSILAVIFGIIALFYYYQKSLQLKNRASNLVRKLEDDRKYAEKKMTDLDTSYGKLNMNEFPDLFDFVMKIPTNHQLGKYSILKSLRVNDNKLLCVTNCIDLDFEVGKYFVKRDVKKYYLYLF